VLAHLRRGQYTILRDPSTAMLAFISGKFDITFPYDLSVPQFNDMRNQMPHAICELSPGIVNAHLLVNREKTPFSDTDLRRAMALSIDRKAVVDTLSQGQGQIGGVLQPPPGGLWGMPPDQVAKLPGYDPDVPRRQEEARQLMQKLGYGPDHRLPIKVTTRDWSIYRDPAVLLIDQLKQHLQRLAFRRRLARREMKNLLLVIRLPSTKSRQCCLTRSRSRIDFPPPITNDPFAHAE
jgi:peptide/nickel transport system substrate-binding protein